MWPCTFHIVKASHDKGETKANFVLIKLNVVVMCNLVDEKGNRVENKIYNLFSPFDIPSRLLILIYIFYVINCDLENALRNMKESSETKEKAIKNFDPEN